MKAVDRVKERLRGARARRPGLDHAVRAYDRHSEVLGGQIAGGDHLLRLPVLLPAARARVRAGRATSASCYPGAQDEHHRRPWRTPSPAWSAAARTRSTSTTSSAAKAGAGLLGLLGLLYAGLGWLDALRDGLRRVFGTLDEPLPFLKKKLVDIVVLLLLGAALLASLIVSSLATSATEYVLDLVGLRGLAWSRSCCSRSWPWRWPCSSTPCCSRSCSPACPGADLRWRQVRSRRAAGRGRLRGPQAARHVPHRQDDPEPALRDVRRRRRAAGLDQLRVPAADLRRGLDRDPALLAGAVGDRWTPERVAAPGWRRRPSRSAPWRRPTTSRCRSGCRRRRGRRAGP